MCFYSCFITASQSTLSLSQPDSALSSCLDTLTAGPLEEEASMGNCFTIPTNNADRAEWQLGYYPTVGQNIIQFSPSSQQCTYYQLYQPTYRPTLPITQQPTLPPPLLSLQPPIRSPIHPPTHLPTTRSLGVSAPPSSSTQSTAEPPNRALDRPYCSTGAIGMKRYLIK